MVRSVLHAVAGFAFVPRLLQRLIADGGAAVLMYHAVIKERLRVPDWCFLHETSFEEQMLYLSDHCQVIPLSEIRAATSARRKRPQIALTFDDGFQNNCAVAMPILRKHGFPATVFLATDFIDSADTPWFCRMNDAISNTSLTRLQWGDEAYDLSSPSARTRTNTACQARLKTFPHLKLVETARNLIRLLGESSDKPIHSGSPYRMLWSHEIREMLATGLIDFGAHSCSHAILSGLPEPERRREIVASLAAVEHLTGSPCTLFAFPNGRFGDYSRSDVSVLEEHGVKVGVTTIAGPNDKETPPLEMRRYGIGAETSLSLFKLSAHHVLWKTRDLRHRYLHGQESNFNTGD